MARKKIRFMLLDLPDDEVENSLSCEREIVKASRLGGRIHEPQ